MAWWSIKSKIPITDKNFQTIITALVFNCPSSINKQPVSARKTSFTRRGVIKHYLTTILAQIRHPLAQNNAYHPVEDSSIAIAERTQQIIKNSPLSDSNFDLIVFNKRNDMPDTEAIFYYIRNAFAHGSFEVISIRGGSRIYFLESKKNETIKALMRLKESTLLHYVKLSELSVTEIVALRKNK